MTYGGDPAALAGFLENVVRRYHHPAFLDSDPLSVVHEFRGARDREMAALFAALLAYGNVKQIKRSLRALFGEMGGRPARFIERLADPRPGSLHGFKHRFTDEEDLLCLSWLLRRLIERDGTLEQAFRRHTVDAEPDLSGAVGRFLDDLFSMSFEPWFDRERMLSKGSFKHLLPRPERGSACKRIHLFLRWAVRPDDGIDLGLWPSIGCDKLLMPVDTHVGRIARNLGLTRGKAASLAVSREITGVLRLLSPADPIRYDFALCRIGILDLCPVRSDLQICGACELHGICERRVELEQSG